MDREALLRACRACEWEWQSALDELGPEGLERPGAEGRWRVRDVLAHFNGWDRWQLVQLRSAFNGLVPAGDELTGGLKLGDPDPALPWTDGMNAAFEAANRDRPAEAVVADWSELCDMRAGWVAFAADGQLDAIVGGDWHGVPGRYIRLQYEVAGVTNPTTAAQFVMDQVDHQRAHLTEIRAWMKAGGAA